MDPFWSATEVAEAIRTGELSPLEAVDTYLARIDRFNGEINAVTWRRDDAVRAEARQMEKTLRSDGPAKPLAGVPIAIKDLTFVAGWPISFGSRAALDHVAGFTSTTIEALAGAGALLLCRTNTPEFGILCITENQAWGATRNPWDLSRTPGGSSGGAAAAVAARLAPIAHASDGGGSIRIPASCCGLVGLKPSRGRVSSGPLISDVMHGGAVEGCVSSTVRDTALVYDILSKSDATAWYNAPPLQRPLLQEASTAPGRLRIAFTTVAPTGTPVAASCVDAVHRTAGLLEELGHHVFEGGPQWPGNAGFVEPFLVIWHTGLALWPVSDWSMTEPLTHAIHDKAGATDSLTYVRALATLQILSRQLVAHWGRDFDVLLTPTLATEPPPIGALYADQGTDPMLPLRKAIEMTPFTPLFNATGQPAISLPMHWTESGLPIGIQLVGRPWGEAELIRLASQLEEAQPWRQRRPPGL
jgi:amidase